MTDISRTWLPVAAMAAALLAGDCSQNSAATCDPSSCQGCCQNGVCQTGTEGAACGRGGVECSDCSASGQSCADFVCSSESGGPDAGSCRTASQQCSANDPCCSGLTCQGNKCVASGGGCASGLSKCGASCLDLKSDPAHCGSCTNACGLGQICSSGSCQAVADCRKPATPCTGLSYCDLATGQCKPGCAADAQCDAATESCDLTTHACTCQVNFHRCGATCVSDLSPATCGNRCSACSSAANAVATCDGTSCGMACQANFEMCGGACAVCPTGPSINSLGCDGAKCVATSCSATAHACGNSCCPWIHDTVDSAGDVGRISSLALDAAGNPHIAYSDDTNLTLKYAEWTGTSWAIQTVAPVSSQADGWQAQSISLALDSAGKPRIAFTYSWTFRVSWAGNKIATLKYAEWTGTAWSVQTVDGVAVPPRQYNDSGEFCSLALDSSDTPHISYRGDTGTAHVLRHAKRIGTNWSIETADPNSSGEYTSIALDSAGNPHISNYRSASWALSYSSWNGTLWRTEFVGAADVGSTSLALDANGGPHIAFVDSYTPPNSNKEFAAKYATSGSAGWSVRAASDWGRGQSPSLALDPAGNPHIVHRAWTLNYYQNPGSGWTSQQLDPNGGGAASLKIDATGSPHVSYYDKTSNVLMYAH